LTDDRRFAQLTSIACHELRTPLATVSGFARTLARLELAEPAGQYAGMIEAAAAQLRDLLEQLTIVARIETGRFDPALGEIDTLELARAASEELGDDRVSVSGSGTPVRVPVEATRRAVTQLARAALRHGGLDLVELRADGHVLELSPTTRMSGAVLCGEELRDIGALAAGALVRALGGSLELDGERLLVRLPQ